MAKENIKAFFEAQSQDEAIQKALKEKELAYTGAKENREAVVKEVLLPVAEEAGYAFTLDELKEFEKEAQAERELDEAELESVAGGATWGVCIFVGVGWGGWEVDDGMGCRVLGVTVCIAVGAGL